MKITKKNINKTVPFVTKDKSIIRSILDKSNSPVKNESLAEATLKPGGHTLEHRHNSTEEIYYFIQGTGLMFLKGSKIKVKAGDAVLIPPGTNHALINNGKTTMKLLCACAPAYSHKDTITTESPYKLVVFDFDGTLADTVGGILATANIMAKGFKTKGYTKEKIALTIGTGLDSFLQGLFPKQYARLGARTMINIYRKIYDKKFKVALKVYPKVAQTLKFLKSKNIKTIIV